MYHDEFEADDAGRDDFGAGFEDRAARLAIEAGGGISLAMAASLVAGPLLPALYDIAAILPLAATAAMILARRCVETRERATILMRPPVASPTYRGPTRRPAGAGARRVRHGNLA